MEQRESEVLHRLHSFKDNNSSTNLWLTCKGNILNGCSNQQYYLRKRTLEGILSIVLIIQMLLLHCYVTLAPFSSSLIYKLTRQAPTSYAQENSVGELAASSS